MGLDLFIRKRGKTYLNKKGQQTWTVTEVAALRNSWHFLELLELENCADSDLLGSTLYEAAEQIKSETEKDYVLSELDAARIEKDRFYTVRAWW